MIDTAAAEAHAHAAHAAADEAKHHAEQTAEEALLSAEEARRLDEIVQLYRLADWLIEHPHVPLRSAWWTPAYGPEHPQSQMSADDMLDLADRLRAAPRRSGDPTDRFDAVYLPLVTLYAAPGELVSDADVLPSDDSNEPF